MHYLTTSIHSHLALSVTMCLYNPPCLCPSMGVFTILVLDLDRISDLKFLAWVAFQMRLLAIAPSLSLHITFHCFRVWYFSLRTRRWSLMIWLLSITAMDMSRSWMGVLQWVSHARAACSWHSRPQLSILSKSIRFAVLTAVTVIGHGRVKMQESKDYYEDRK